MSGPSPRVRGSPKGGTSAHPGSGSIPACAGKPITGLGDTFAQRVHPRVCGEAAKHKRLEDSTLGPSPRVRGSPHLEVTEMAYHGSIPACAGKPPRGTAGPAHPRVHPRVCGEAHLGTTHAWLYVGPSPRVRGSPYGKPSRFKRIGSIPACAGKPAPSRPQLRAAEVHPRVCGEADPPTAGTGLG